MKEEIKNILWVDDEIDQLQSHILFLKEKGYEVTQASNGDDALALVEKKNFDLVLLDEMMPGKDGLITLEEIKKINPHLPVIMVTKSEEERLMDQAIGKKINDYLVKPVNPIQIISAAKRILDTKKIREEELSKRYVEDFNSVRSLLSGPMDWQNWVEIHLLLSQWDLELDIFRDVGLRQTHQTQRRECNLEFGKFVERNYPLWLEKNGGPILSPHIIKKYVFPPLREKTQLFFFVVDCMRLDQWLAIEPTLGEYFNIKREFYYSILPTATPYSRNAIFSGLFPDQLASRHPEIWKKGADDDTSLNRFERVLLEKQLQKLGLSFKVDPKYIKILQTIEGERLSKTISSFSSVPLLSVVVNFLDILAHGRSESEILQEITPDESAFRSLMRSWFLHSHLFDILKYLSTRDCQVILTTDHGSVLGTRATIAYGKKDTSTNLRYKYGDNLNCDSKQAVLIKNPKEFKLPTYSMSTTYIIAKEDFYFVYPTKYSEYKREYKNSFQHGGISLEEMILPVVIMSPKK